MNLYKEDEYKWKIDTAKQYKNENTNLFEYLMEMSKSEERSVKSYLRVLFMHLLKYQYQPKKQTNSWIRSIGNARREIRDIFQDSVTLYSKYLLLQYYLISYANAREEVAEETGLPSSTFPKEFPWDPKNVWTEAFVTEFLAKYKFECSNQ